MIVEKNISWDTMLSEGRKLEYALVYRISELILLPAVSLEKIHLDDECQEARIFSNQEEYHYFPLNGEMCIVHIKDEGEEDVIDRAYKLDCNKKLKENAKVSILHVRSYIDYDEDGQAFTKLTRLLAVE